MDLKRKPSGIFFVEFTDADTGKRRRVSTNSRDKDEARRIARDIVLGVAGPVKPAAKAGKQDGRLTMKDLFTRAEKTVWAPGQAKSQATIRSNIKILTSYVGDVPIEDMTYSRLETLMADLKAAGYAPGTIKRKLDAVSKVLSMATKWTDEGGRPLLGYKPSMPPIRVENHKDRVLEPHEETAVFRIMEAKRLEEPTRQWWRMIRLVRLLIDSGVRLGEALMAGPVNIKTVMVGGKPYHFLALERYQTKNDKPRSVPLTEAVVAELEALKAQAGLPPREKGKAPAGSVVTDKDLVLFPMNKGLIWYMWDQVREQAKKEGLNLDDVTLHTMRHTCATRLYLGGMDIYRLKEWLGHKDIKVTIDRYAHLRPANLVEGLLILNGSNGSSEQNPSGNHAFPANMPGMEGAANRGDSGAVSIQ